MNNIICKIYYSSNKMLLDVNIVGIIKKKYSLFGKSLTTQTLNPRKSANDSKESKSKGLRRENVIVVEMKFKCRFDVNHLNAKIASQTKDLPDHQFFMQIKYARFLTQS